MKTVISLLLTGTALCWNTARADDTIPSRTPADSVPQITIAPDTAPAPPVRKVTPIQNTDGLTARPTLHYYDRHGKPLDEPVAIWLDEDTVKVERGPKYPLLNGYTVGINFFDAILQLAGQSYGSYNLSASMDIHNWIFPTLELGVGFASTHPKGKNYHYKCDGAFFGRIGVDYNFLYNSDPAYKALFGLRLGYSGFGYDITDISIPSGYWSNQTEYPAIPHQKASALWGEVGAGLQVKIYGPLSMGWSFRYRIPFHISDGADSSPWFIPGYGARNAHFSATLSVFYTF